jgi:hypothetical protein
VVVSKLPYFSNALSVENSSRTPSSDVHLHHGKEEKTSVAIIEVTAKVRKTFFIFGELGVWDYVF